MGLQRGRRRLAGSIHLDKHFTNEDLRSGIAEQAVFRNCTFRGCNLSRIKAGGSLFEGCHFEDTEFCQADLRARFNDCTFLDCDLDESVFVTSILHRTVFEQCRLEYAAFSRATVVGGGFLDCQFHGAYLDFAESDGVDFTGSNLWGAVIPLSCSFFVGNRFDHRQVNMLEALSLRSLLPADDAMKLSGIVDPKIKKLVDRLTTRINVPEA